MLADQKINYSRAIQFSTKAQTLHDLSSVLVSASILPLYFFTVEEWQANKTKILTEIEKRQWLSVKLVVRSSATDEDGQHQSNAGYYESVINVQGQEKLIEAVEFVIDSYDNGSPYHQVLVQPQLMNVAIAGVAFTLDPNTSAPYTIINYAENGDTTAVTSGQSNQKCLVTHNASNICHDTFKPVINLLSELQALFVSDRLDVEFAIDQKGTLYLFQVRPLVCRIDRTPSFSEHQKALERIANAISANIKPHPYLYGKQTVYGVMPDWNPAEIIGIRPKPLALSLYRELVTNAVWAYQRDNYGYANLRSFPLLVDFEGLPYIDVRVSFNSFLPKGLPDSLSEKLVNYYLDQLIQSPSLHDKVEFDIVFSCYTLDLTKRLTKLTEYHFSESEQKTIADSLINLTNGIIHNQEGLWKKDLDKIKELERRQQLIFNSELDYIAKMYWILEDCKRYGTLPFAGLARAGFIAIQILKSFISEDIITEAEYANFLSSINSVSSRMTTDFVQLNKDAFLDTYGHLRPGTYDIQSYRYDEQPDLYFKWENATTNDSQVAHAPFSLTISQLRKIQACIDRDKLNISTLELLEFIKTAVESREYSKFIFSRSVSEFLKLTEEYAATYGINRDDCAYLNLNTLMSLYSSCRNPADMLHKSIRAEKDSYELTSTIQLPPLITDSSQVWLFDIPETSPNFITQNMAIGHVATPNIPRDMLTDSILLIPSADPGYDWIFSHRIAGFITQYGGVNSHMAIRAGELGIPAVIGAGEIKFLQWIEAKTLKIDCLNKQVQIL